VTDSGQERLPPALYIVSTPIGNLKDVTFRALDVLRAADIVAAEDTRRTRILLAHYGASRRLLSYRDRNKEVRAPKLVQTILAGSSVALVSDGGTPGISDPGYYLIRMAVQRGIDIVPIPGPTAAIAALVASGLPCDRFAFEGFLPSRPGRKRRRLEELRTEPRTLVIYEAPHRLKSTLVLMAQILGDRSAAVARELTKVFEEIRRGSLSELAAYYQTEPARGEIVIILEGARQQALSDVRQHKGDVASCSHEE
jgi:16S rRNA (cytidine1402-2'-O)-methyltransferase